ncbi:MAG: hypothetical protein EHM64_05435 [Ignavibacteriae bacterium]|nr:MAG: hypothetical protein EHM64_05435 [Ignavibacteriota bacterium]
MNDARNRQKFFLSAPTPLLGILMIACLVRIITAMVMGTMHSDFYWEYGEIAKNILAGRGYSLYYISNNELAFRFNSSVTPFPSALMAPGYVGFLLPFLMIRNVQVCNGFIIVIQTVLSLLTIYLIYKFTAKYFSERAALIACVMAGILPDFAYTVVSFTPTALYHLGMIAVMILLYATMETTPRTRTIQLSVLFVLLSYLRGEFILFVILFLLFQIFSRQWKQAGMVLIVSVSLLSPWTIRNYYALGHFVPLSTGFGLNFYRGNNPEEIGSWGNDDIKREILTLPQDRSFEVHLDHLYRQHAFNFILSHPWQELSNIPVKLFHLWVFSPLQERSNWYLFQLASGCFFVLSMTGLITTFSWQRHKYLYLLLFYSTVIALLFFTLPRHQTMMKIVLLPLAGAGLEYLWNVMRQKRKTP